MEQRNQIMTAEVASKKLRRMALQVVEQNYTESQLVLIGIKQSGSVIAASICRYIKEIFSGEVILLELSIDKKNPLQISLDSDMDLNNKTIILADDVANSGRTMLYALKPLLNQLPKKVQTLALVERTHKSFPVDVDYVGFSVSTTPDEHILVEVANGEVTGAWLETSAGLS